MCVLKIEPITSFQFVKILSEHFLHILVTLGWPKMAGAIPKDSITEKRVGLFE